MGTPQLLPSLDAEKPLPALPGLSYPLHPGSELCLCRAALGAGRWAPPAFPIPIQYIPGQLQPCQVWAVHKPPLPWKRFCGPGAICSGLKVRMCH